MMSEKYLEEKTCILIAGSKAHCITLGKDFSSAAVSVRQILPISDQHVVVKHVGHSGGDFS